MSSKILTLDLGQYNTPTQLAEESKEEVEEEELSPIGKSEEPEDGDEEDPEEEDRGTRGGRGGKRKMPITKGQKTTTTVMKVVSNKQKLKQ